MTPVHSLPHLIAGLTLDQSLTVWGIVIGAIIGIAGIIIPILWDKFKKRNNSEGSKNINKVTNAAITGGITNTGNMSNVGNVVSNVHNVHNYGASQAPAADTHSARREVALKINELLYLIEDQLQVLYNHNLRVIYGNNDKQKELRQKNVGKLNMLVDEYRKYIKVHDLYFSQDIVELLDGSVQDFIEAGEGYVYVPELDGSDYLEARSDFKKDWALCNDRIKEIRENFRNLTVPEPQPIRQDEKSERVQITQKKVYAIIAMLIAMAGAAVIIIWVSMNNGADKPFNGDSTAPSPIIEINPDDGRLTPHRIFSELKSIQFPAQRQAKVKLYINADVNWILILSNVSVYAPKNNEFSLSFIEYDEGSALSNHKDNPLIVANIPIKGNEYLRFAKQDQRFRVRGTISDVNDYNQIELKGVSIERQDSKNTTPPSSAIQTSTANTPTPATHAFSAYTSWTENQGNVVLYWYVSGNGRTPIYECFLVNFTNLSPKVIFIDSFKAEYQDKDGKWLQANFPYVEGSVLFRCLPNDDLKDVKQEIRTTLESAFGNKNIAPNETVRGWIFVNKPKAWPSRLTITTAAGETFTEPMPNGHNSTGWPSQPTMMGSGTVHADISNLPISK